MGELTSGLQKNVELIGAILTEVPVTHDTYERPMTISNDPNDAVNEMLDLIQQSKSIAPGTLAGTASHIVAPSWQPGEQIVMPMGDTGRRRFAFQLKLHVTNWRGEQIEIISGFTNHCGVCNLSGNLDPNMEFYVNSVQVLSLHRKVGAGGESLHHRNRMSAQVLGIVPEGFGGSTLRPVDIVSQNVSSFYGANKDLMTLRGPVSKLAMANSVSPANYFSQLLRGYVGEIHNGTGFSASQEGYNSVMGNLEHVSITQTAFYEELYINRNKDFLSNPITFKDIQGRWPRDNTFWVKSLAQQHIDYTIDTQRWSDMSDETWVSYMLSQIVPSILAGLNMTSITCVIEQEYGVQEPSIVLGVCTMLMPNDPLPALALKNAILRDIVVSVLNRYHCYKVYIQMGIMTSGNIKVLLNDGVVTPYHFGSYATSLNSPQVVSSRIGQEHLPDLATGLEYICANISDFVATEQLNGNPIDYTANVIAPPLSPISAALNFSGLF